MVDKTRSVALLIDYDNLEIGASRDLPSRALDLTPVVQLAQRYGTVVAARAYADWNDPGERLAVYSAGIEPVYAPVFRAGSSDYGDGKSIADTVLVTDGVDILWQQRPDVLVIVSSDKDLLPLVRLAKLRGTKVTVVGSDRTAVTLQEMADEYYSYRDLLAAAQQPPQPVPARPRSTGALTSARFLVTGVRGARVGAEQPGLAPAPGLEPRREVAAVAPVEAVAATSEVAVPAHGGRRRRRRGGRSRRGGGGAEAAAEAVSVAERTAEAEARQAREDEAGVEAAEESLAEAGVLPTPPSEEVAVTAGEIADEADLAEAMALDEAAQRAAELAPPAPSEPAVSDRVVSFKPRTWSATGVPPTEPREGAGGPSPFRPRRLSRSPIGFSSFGPVRREVRQDLPDPVRPTAPSEPVAPPTHEQPPQPPADVAEIEAVEPSVAEPAPATDVVEAWGDSALASPAEPALGEPPAPVESAVSHEEPSAQAAPLEVTTSEEESAAALVATTADATAEAEAPTEGPAAPVEPARANRPRRRRPARPRPAATAPPSEEIEQPT